MHRIHHRWIDREREVRHSKFVASIHKLARETLNIFRQKLLIERLLEMRRTFLLCQLLTELTVDRIVELVQRMDPADQQELLESPTLGRIPPIMRDYVERPPHYGAELFLMHPEFWRRLQEPQTEIAAPNYPLR